GDISAPDVVAAAIRGAQRTAEKLVLAPRRAGVLVNEPGSVDRLLAGLAPARQIGSIGPNVPGIVLDENVARHVVLRFAVVVHSVGGEVRRGLDAPILGLLVLENGIAVHQVFQSHAPPENVRPPGLGGVRLAVQASGFRTPVPDEHFCPLVVSPALQMLFVEPPVQLGGTDGVLLVTEDARHAPESRSRSGVVSRAPIRVLGPDYDVVREVSILGLFSESHVDLLWWVGPYQRPPGQALRLSYRVRNGERIPR